MNAKDMKKEKIILGCLKNLDNFLVQRSGGGVEP